MPQNSSTDGYGIPGDCPRICGDGDRAPLGDMLEVERLRGVSGPIVRPRCSWGAFLSPDLRNSSKYSINSSLQLATDKVMLTVLVQWLPWMVLLD